MMRSIVRIIVVGVIGILLFLGSVTGVYYYFAVGKQYDIQELVTEVVWTETGAYAHFDDYRFRLGGDFPFISLRLRNVVLRDSAFAEHRRELLRVKEVGVSFRPWELIKGDLVIKSIRIDSAKVMLYRSPAGRMNLIVKKKAHSPQRQEEREPSNGIFSIDKIQVNGLDFEFLDSMRLKDYHVDLGQSVFLFNSGEETDLVRIQGDWFFHGLTFKMEAGSFLTDKAAKVDLLVEIDPEANQIYFRPSRLKIDGNNYDIEGTLTPGKPAAHLQLRVSNPGIPYADALGMVNAKIRHGLKNFSVGSPVQFELLLEGLMLPGQPLPLTLDFSFTDSDFSFKTIHFTGASAKGHFDNNCDPSGIVDPHSGCLTVPAFTGKLAGKVPTTTNLKVRDLEDPLITADLRSEMPLTEIGDFLSPGKLQARGGTVDVAVYYQGKPSRLERIAQEGFQDSLSGSIRIREGVVDFQSPAMQVRDIDAELAFDDEELRIGKLNLLVNEDAFRMEGCVDGFLPFVLDPSRNISAELEVWTPRLVVDNFLTSAGKTIKKRNKKNSNPEKPSHFGEVIEGLFAKVEADLRIHAGEVMYRKLQAKDVLVVSQLKNECEGIPGGCLRVDTFQVTIFEGIPVFASLTLYNPGDPFLKLDALIRADLPSLKGLAPPEKIQFRKGAMDIDLHYEGRLEDYLDVRMAALNASLIGEVRMRDIALDYLPQGYRIEDLQGALNFDERHLTLDSLSLSINNTQLLMRGAIDDFIPFVFDPAGKLVANLKISTPNLDFANFSRRKKVEKKRDARRKVPGENAVASTVETLLDRITGNLEVDAGELHFRSFDARDVHFQATFLEDCQENGEGGGCVIVDMFTAVLFNDAPLQASLKIENLVDPFFTVVAATKMELEDLNPMFPDDKFVFYGGTATVEFTYAGRPHQHFNATHLVLNAALDGRARLQNAAFDVVAKGYKFRNVNANLGFDENDLQIRGIDLKINNNELFAHGEIRKFIPFILVPEQSLSVVLDVSSDAIDFGNFSAPKNFENIQKDSTYQPTAITEVVDNALSKIEADLKLSSKEVKYESFYAKNIEGEFRMNPEMMALSKVKMDIARGTFYVDGKIGGLNANTPKIDILTSFDHVDVSEVFTAFDNFGQDDLTSENIRGDLTAVIAFSGEANSNYDLIPETMEGRLDFEIVDGQLMDMPALMKINNFLFRNRNMNNVQFATLQNTFILEGGHFELSEFKIFSTALAILIEGRYCLNDNEHTDLLVSVPLANLWKNGLSVERLEEFRTGTRRGIRVLLRAHNKDGTMKVNPVLSKKGFRKDLEE